MPVQRPHRPAKPHTAGPPPECSSEKGAPLKKTPAFLALALLIAAAGCSHGADHSTPPSDGVITDSTGNPSTGGTTGGSTGGGSTGGGGAALATTPPADGTTPWAPDPADATFVNVRSLGAVGDGSTDDTAAFRAAAATGKQIFVPEPPVAYVLTGFVGLRSSIYGDGSMPLIRMVGADGDPDQGHQRNMLYVSGYRGAGLVIQGLHLDGGWTGGTNGEWSHNVNVGNSSNVTIQHNTLERPYGDNVFVGEFGGTPSANVVIQYNDLLNPRRCNAGINSLDGGALRGNRILKLTSDYVSAIDLEPDPLGFQFVRNVSIDANAVDVMPLSYGAGAFSLNNPNGNAAATASGNISVTNNHGTWTNAFSYMDIVPGSNGILSVVPHLTWYGLSASNNVHD